MQCPLFNLSLALNLSSVSPPLHPSYWFQHWTSSRGGFPGLLHFPEDVHKKPLFIVLVKLVLISNAYLLFQLYALWIRKHWFAEIESETEFLQTFIFSCALGVCPYPLKKQEPTSLHYIIYWLWSAENTLKEDIKDTSSINDMMKSF